jgi:hypothetical protein
MTRFQPLYRISIDPDELAAVATPPPLAASRSWPRPTWDFTFREFDRIPALRAWIAAEGITGVGEQGFAQTGGRLSDDDSLVGISPASTSDAALLGGELFADQVCGRCGLATRSVHPEPRLELDREPRAGPLVTYVRAADGIVMPAPAVNALRAAGLGRGLALAPVEAPGEPHILVYAGPGVGEPVAPYGYTGEPCSTCGRRVRVVDSRPYPGLPRYAFYWLFERPDGEPQWVWNAIHGQLRPMVTPDVARWLAARDATVAFRKHGWSPHELDAAFLPEEYR